MPDQLQDIDPRSLQEFLKTFADIRITGHGARWWRGHGSGAWKLSPSVFRDRDPRFGFNVAQRFYVKARTRYANCPPDGDKAGWTFLMQHYGLPTRLLDWSESILVGLYFVANDRELDNEPGCLWELDAAGLNHAQFSSRGIVGYEHPRVKPVFNMGFDEPNPGNVHPIFAIGAKEVDPRMLIQQSAFTIHGNTTSLEDLPNQETFLRRVDIPAEMKPTIRHWLDFFGIRESYLFPDLEHLANELKRGSYQEAGEETEREPE